MLAIRLQRVGRSGNAQYRIIVQQAQKQPTSGCVVAFVGTYDPHTKDCKVQVEVAQKFLDNGAQPSPRVVKLLTAAGVKMPSWVAKSVDNKKVAKNAVKLRKNQPVVEKVAEVEKPAAEVADEAVAEAVEPRDEHMAEEVAETSEPVESAEVATETDAE